MRTLHSNSPEYDTFGLSKALHCSNHGQASNRGFREIFGRNVCIEMSVKNPKSIKYKQGKCKRASVLFKWLYRKIARRQLIRSEVIKTLHLVNARLFPCPAFVDFNMV